MPKWPLHGSPLGQLEETHSMLFVGSQTAVQGATRRQSHSHRRDLLLCVLLHVGLVVIFIVLCGVYSRHYERRVTMDINHFTTTYASFVVTIVLQIFGTVYLAVLVMLTQRLALRGDLYTQQTLTAIHDKTSAWLGLGPAVTALWDQTKIRSAPTAVSCIVVYLLAGFVLHVNVPGLFNIIPYNATVPGTFPSTLTNATLHDGGDGIPPPLYDILLAYGQVPTLGLLDNVVYDVIPVVPAATGNVTVNASIYDVQCSALPHAVQIPGRGSQVIPPTDFSGPNIFYSVDDIGTQVSVNMPFSNLSVSISSNAEAAEGGAPCPTTIPGQELCWYPFYVVSTLPVVDSTNSLSSNPWKAMYPQVLTQNNVDNSAEVVTGIQILACALSINNTKIDVSAQNRTPVDTASLSPPAQVWKNWTWPSAPIAPEDSAKQFFAQTLAFRAVSSPHLDQPSVFAIENMNITQTPTGPIYVSLSSGVVPPPLNVSDTNAMESIIIKDTTQVAIDVTVLDTFLMEDLGIFTGNKKNITLAEINMSVGRAFAAAYWYATSLNYSDPRVQTMLAESQVSFGEQGEASPWRVTRGPGEATIMTSTQRLRLNLGLAPLLLSLGASLVLLATSAALVRTSVLAAKSSLGASPAGDARSEITSAGILQTTWLLGHEPHLARVEVPDVQALRAAGMFEVHVRRPFAEKGDEEEMVDDEADGKLGYGGGKQDSGVPRISVNLDRV